MYLLNDQQIRHYVEDTPRGTYLDIMNFDPKSLQHTYYYFRLGSEYEVHGESGSQILRLTAREANFSS